MDRETFNKMWEMSEPGSDSEKCFMRIPQIEYYKEKRFGVNCLEVMPEVSAPISICDRHLRADPTLFCFI